MPYLERQGAALYFEEVGEGPAILTTHGVTENGLYWILPGIVDRLVHAGYRVISTDMRAHGRTRVTGEPPSPLEPPPGCAYHRRCPHAEARCLRESPHLRVLEPRREVACHLAPLDEPAPKPAIEN